MLDSYNRSCRCGAVYSRTEAMALGRQLRMLGLRRDDRIVERRLGSNLQVDWRARPTAPN